MRRAETRDEGPTTVGDELLSAFKMASFAFEEDKETQSDNEQLDDDTRDWVRQFKIKAISCNYSYCWHLIFYHLGWNHSWDISSESWRGGKSQRNGGPIPPTTQ